MDKKTARLRRAKRTRRNFIEQGKIRLVIHRTPRHIYAQVISAEGSVLAAASTVEKAIAETVKGTGNIEAAQAVGKAVAERAAEKGVNESIAFDRSGFKYHGRVKALADAAREAGLQF
ncbi:MULTISPECIES: 50S ribosomal protein L18 [Pseudoalteromonas]|uniref:50S ribosomal protein L18 n=1 Tax=Pseudoalteromonas TaxID=53246 RepID=UPI0032428E82